jgi:HK97 family phage major capsid protein
MTRAYSLLTIKSINEDERTIEGIATTPAVDMADDIVDPLGGEFTLPIPFLHQHDPIQPTGHVIEAVATKEGIKVKVKFVKVDEPPTLKERLDVAWMEVKTKLVRGLSIGFMPIESSRIEGTWGSRYTKWTFLELSAVTIPCNSEASIQTIKSFDQRQRRAASGAPGASSVVHLKSLPGASGRKPIIPKGTEMKTIAEQIASFEAKRQASAARMNDIMSKSADEGRTLDDTESEEYESLQSEVKAVDAHIVRLKSHEATVVASATPITKTVGSDPSSASAARGGSGGVELRGNIISVKQNIEPGVKMARYAMALFRSKGNLNDALSICQNEKRWMDQTPEVATVLKAAVAAGDTTTSGWASELVYNQNLASEFIEFLRPMTILGKLQGLRQVPFNIRVASQTSSSTGYWVGQGAPVPVSKPGVSSQTLGIAKCAGLVSIDEELAMSSSPSAELLVRDDLAKTISTFMDVQFVDPNVALVANVNPASITNGLTAIVPTGTAAANLRTDLATMLKTWAQGDLDASKGAWIMTPNQALNIGLLLNSLGLPLYPNIDITGGTLLGLPVIVSNSANIPGSPDSGNMIILVNPQEIFVADEGQVTIQVSNEASIQMLDNPTNASTGGTTATTMVSMFQTHSLALRATRYINWSKRRSIAAVYMKEAGYLA